MSVIPSTAAKPHRSHLYASSFLVSALSLGISAADAQQANPDQLPPITVSPPRDENQTRAKPVTDQDSNLRRVTPTTSSTGNPNGAPATSTNVSIEGNGTT